ncbi:HTH-type transcriptional regulator GbpR [Shewanella sp. P1-14-1]|uniref:LysR family transcriptional regulator n=1 Tax=Shewanella sp. P1-14-1 TaxID=1723761 RepID=UPI0006D65DD7|nr:LysR family transcriptional regulator [Shewanella sp. P1-14-1]KPZ67851.1 HTH-type transcriptional regulator GbpR [Shewanella sp. P1-14-1]
MELRHIKHFVLLAEVKNFNKAAEILNITQPSLSKSIKRLELLIGGQLLNRDSKPVFVTALGQVLLKHGQKILKEFEEMEQEVTLFQGVDDKELRVGASPIPSNSLVGPIVGEFLRHYADMSVELKVAPWEDLYQQLIYGDIDFFVAETKVTELEKSELLTITKLPPFKVIFCCRPNHPLTQLQRLFLPSFRDYPLAIPRHMPQSIADAFEDLFKQQREDFSGMVRFDQFHPIKESIINGDLVALTPEISVRSQLEKGVLVELSPYVMPLIYARFSVVSLKEKSHSNAAEGFIDFLVKRAEDVKLESPMQNEKQETVLA